MARVDEILAYVQQLAPPELAESWDNPGLLVDCGAEVTSILVALDVTDEVIAEAEYQGCQLIVTHHPVLLKPLRSLARGSLPYRLIKKNISALCAHTNLDAAEGGVNDILCRLLGVQDAQPLDKLARIGRVRTTSAALLAEQCRQVLGAHVKLVDAGKPINRVAVVGGSGGDFLEAAVAAGADALVTGEAGHHTALDARHAGISLVAAGHYATELPIVPVLADKLARKFAGVRVLCSRRCKDPFTYL